jgi:hypothetical protein
MTEALARGHQEQKRTTGSAPRPSTGGGSAQEPVLTTGVDTRIHARP